MNVVYSDNRLFFDNFKSFEGWGKSAISGKSCLQILYLNIRSIRKHWDTLLVQLTLSRITYDIIVLAELGCDEHELSFYNLPGFHTIYKLRQNKGGGGLLMFYRDTFTFTPVLIGEVETYEHITGTLELNTQSKLNVNVHAIYRPPSSCSGFSVPKAIREMDKVLQSLSAPHSLIVIGDVNLDIYRSNDTNVIDYETTLASWGLERGIYDFTREEFRLNNLVQSCIDHIYYRIESPISRVFTGIIQTKISDHYPIVARLELQVEGETEIAENGKIGRFNEPCLRNKLMRVDWSLQDFNSVNKGFEELLENFNKLYSDSMYSGQKIIEERIVKYDQKSIYCKKEWMTDYILNLIKERDRVFKLWKGDKANIGHRNVYKNLRNRTMLEIKVRKNTYYRTKFERNINNPRKLWENVNQLLGRNKKSNVDETIATAMGRDKNSIEIVSSFANHFIEGVRDIKHTCVHLDNAIPLGLGLNETIFEDDYEPPYRLYVPKATPDKIIQIINNIDEKKSPGVDKIRMKDIKLISKKISKPLSLLINSSISQGIFPDCLKTSIVRPIYKSNSKKDVKNYRPIAILSSIDKVIERYMLIYLNKYLDENNTLSSAQYGFRKKLSTQKALEDFGLVGNSVMNSKYHGLALFIDFSKAFDTINHNEIIKALHNIGIRGNFLKWFKSYLEDRFFIVKALNTFSEKKKMDIGLPQGSQLGPVLFIIYLDQMLKKIENCHIWAYADDILVLAAHKDLRVAEEYLQKDFDRIIKWSHDKGLVINQKKTSLMHICPKNMKFDGDISIQWHDCDCLHKIKMCNCELITVVDNTKYLGVIVDKKLVWKDHIAAISKKLTPCIAIMYRLQNKVPLSIKVIIYKALFESVLRYGVTLWGNAAQSHIGIINNIQKRCLKALFRSERDNNLDLNFVEREGIGLASMEGQLTVRGLYSAINYNKYFGTNQYKVATERTRVTRISNRPQYQICIPSTEYGKRLPEFIIPHLFNALPSNIEVNPSRTQFKQAMVEWLIRNDG